MNDVNFTLRMLYRIPKMLQKRQPAQKNHENDQKPRDFRNADLVNRDGRALDSIQKPAVVRSSDCDVAAHPRYDERNRLKHLRIEP